MVELIRTIFCMHLGRQWVVLLTVLLIGASAVYSRGTGYARALQEIDVPVTGDPQIYNLTVFGITSGEKQCIFQGYPGSRADSVVPGPLVFQIPSFINMIRTQIAASPGSYIALYNSSQNVLPANNPATGLIGADYFRSSPTSSGYVLAGLISSYDSNDPQHDAASPPSCFVNVTFLSLSSSPVPAPSSGLA